MMKIKKKILNCLNASSEILATRGRFPPRFLGIGCHMNTRAAECMKIGTRVFSGLGTHF